eukprot:m.106120 g.106120  ORF g.106120 m.106120 type:complete len:142 (-) comp9168_c0_seq1:1026-1451(-)
MRGWGSLGGGTFQVSMAAQQGNAVSAIDEAAPPKYFHGAISRAEAESRLAAAGMADGTFLVREKFPDTAYALSICADGQVFHLMFERQERDDGTFGTDFVSDGVLYEGCSTVDQFVQRLATSNGEGLGMPVLGTPLARPSA